MSTLSFCIARVIVVFGVVFELTSCGGTLPASRTSPTDAQVQGSHNNPASIASFSTRRSWLFPDAGSRDLLYVTDLQQVRIFSYPRGRYEGTLHGFQLAVGDCADAEGNVYVADYGYGQLFEYAHGGTKRIRTLSPGDAAGCAVDPSSGNLAVTNLSSDNRRRTGSLAIYTNASGTPTYYRDKDFLNYYFCGYDTQGDLFVDGITELGSGHVVFAELPKGASKLTTIGLDQYIGFPGGVQWDGQHVVVGDQSDATVYAFAINGSQGTLTGETHFNDAKDVTQTWIQGRKIIVPNTVGGPDADVLIYDYPAGGSPVKTIPKHVLEPQGATISRAPTT